MRGGKQKDVIQQYGMESDMAVEMRQMIHQMDCNVPLEQLLEDFAERSRIEDVEQFAGIFLMPSGAAGDFTAIMGNTVRQMADRMELQETIETALTARKMEQKVMNVIPFIYTGICQCDIGKLFGSIVWECGGGVDYDRVSYSLWTGISLVRENRKTYWRKYMLKQMKKQKKKLAILVLLAAVLLGIAAEWMQKAGISF